MMRFLQSNLNHCRAAQDILCQALVEKRTDIAIISEPYAKSISGNVRWILDRSGRAALGVMNDKFTVSEIEKEDGFVAAKVNGVTVYSCYASPNSPITSFRAVLDKLEQSARQKQGDIIIAGDFNARSAAWMDTVTNPKGEDLSLLVDTLRLNVANAGGDPTFVGRGAGSIVDVTFVSETLARRMMEWKVLEDENASDHRYIEFRIESQGRSRAHGPDIDSSNGRGWIVANIDYDLLSTGLFLAEWTVNGNTTDAGPDELAAELERGITLACDFALKAKPPESLKRRPVPWWNSEIASARNECFRLRRALTRARRRALEEAVGEHAEFREARKKLNKLIKRSKEKCWNDLTKIVENDPWGKPYKIVMRKLQGPPALNRLEPDILTKIIDSLFPQHLPLVNEGIAREAEVEEFSVEEVTEIVGKFRSRNKAPGPDKIPSKVWGAVHDIRPQLLTGIFNRCLKTGTFPASWKRGRLTLLRKGNKPEGIPSSYRPLCLLNDVGKILEALLANRLKDYIRRVKGNSNRQYGFTKGVSIEDAIRKLESIVIPSCNWQRYSVAVSLDIKNAFNNASWSRILDALFTLRTPPYLLRMIESYLSERSITCQTPAAGIISREVTSGVPQGSVLGPLLWNIMFDGLLRVRTPPGTTTICFADDTLVIAEGGTTQELETRTNEAIDAVSRWIEEAGLSLSAEKTEAVLFTNRYKYTAPVLIMNGTTLTLSKSMKYLGLIVESSMLYKEHIKYAATRAQSIMTSLGRLMPNLGGPRQARRKLLCSVVHSVLLYGAPVWRRTLDYVPANVLELQKVQRRAAIRTICGYRTLSHVASNVLAGLPPIQLLAREQEEAYFIRRNTGRKATFAEKYISRTRTLTEWNSQLLTAKKGEWTRVLIKDLASWCNRRHGQMTYRLTQMLSGHGCFGTYLNRIRKETDTRCHHCGAEVDDAKHTLFECEAWLEERKEVSAALGTFDPDTLVERMTTDAKRWETVIMFAEKVMRMKEEHERARRGENRREENN